MFLTICITQTSQIILLSSFGSEHPNPQFKQWHNGKNQSNTFYTNLLLTDLNCLRIILVCVENYAYILYPIRNVGHRNKKDMYS